MKNSIFRKGVSVLFSLMLIGSSLYGCSAPKTLSERLAGTWYAPDTVNITLESNGDVKGIPGYERWSLDSDNLVLGDAYHTRENWVLKEARGNKANTYSLEESGDVLYFSGRTYYREGSRIYKEEKSKADKADGTQITPLEDGSYYTLYKGHKYQVFTTSISWGDAYLECQKHGGYLVSVNDKDEQKFLNSLMTAVGKMEKTPKHLYWLGLFNDTEGKWAWADGQKLGYTNWAPGEPNSLEGDELVTEMYAADYEGAALGQWNDSVSQGSANQEGYFGISHIGYICEWSE